MEPPRFPVASVHMLHYVAKLAMYIKIVPSFAFYPTLVALPCVDYVTLHNTARCTLVCGWLLPESIHL